VAVTGPDPRTGKYAPLDLNRGVQHCQHPDGFFVAMYVDDPGLYMAEDGSPVDDGTAAAAGFDVAKNAKLRERNRLVAEAKAKIDAQFAEDVGKIEQQVDAGQATEDAADGDSVSPGGWTMRKTGKHKYDVIDANGEVVERGVTQDEAKAMLEAAGA
jgi:hypothetical protein